MRLADLDLGQLYASRVGLVASSSTGAKALCGQAHALVCLICIGIRSHQVDALRGETWHHMAVQGLGRTSVLDRACLVVVLQGLVLKLREGLLVRVGGLAPEWSSGLPNVLGRLLLIDLRILESIGQRALLE